MKLKQKFSCFVIFLAFFAFTLVNGIYVDAQTYKSHSVDTIKKIPTNKKFTEKDLKNISVGRFRLELNGIKIPDNRVSDVMDVLDPKLGTAYYKGRQFAKIGTGLLITGSVLSIGSLVSYARDVLNSLDVWGGANSDYISSATKVTGIMGSSLLLTSIVTIAVGSSKKSKAFKEFSKRRAEKYSHTKSVPSINLTPYYAIGSSMPTSCGLKLTIGL